MTLLLLFLDDEDAQQQVVISPMLSVDGGPVRQRRRPSLEPQLQEIQVVELVNHSHARTLVKANNNAIARIWQIITLKGQSEVKLRLQNVCAVVARVVNEIRPEIVNAIATPIAKELYLKMNYRYYRDNVAVGYPSAEGPRLKRMQKITAILGILQDIGE